jgi:disulfide bond formation protein DsbB
MITLSMISFLFGAALGQRFNVVVLIPAMAIVLVLSAGAGLTQAQTAWWIVLMAATAATCLQFGYFVGIGIRHFLVAATLRRSSPLEHTSARHAAR